MRIQRLYTASGHDAYATLPFATIALEVGAAGDTPTVLEIEVPSLWPFQAVTALAAQALQLQDVPKRVRKLKETGVPPWLWRSVATEAGKTTHECSFKAIFDRVAGALTYAGWKSGHFTSKTEAQTFYDELRYLMASQKLAFAPQLYALTGLYWGYGLTGEIDNGVWLDPQTNRLRTRVLQYEQPLLSHAPEPAVIDFATAECAGLIAEKEAATVEDAIFALGCEAMQNQLQRLYQVAQTGSLLATATHISQTTGVPQKIAQTTVTAAHAGKACPVVPDFVQRRALTINGKNFVRVMPTPEPQNAGRWHDLIDAIWHHGDPALSFVTDDAATHAPGATLNLTAFLRDDGVGAGGFDAVGFKHACQLATIALDIALGQASYQDENSARQARQRRDLGLGFANLAPTLLALGQAYDSPIGRATAASITALMTGTAYEISAMLAGQNEPAPAFKESREPILRQLRSHRRAVYGATEPHEPPGIALDDCADLALIAAARRSWDMVVETVAVAGLRNISVSSIPEDSITRDFLGAETCGITPLKRLAHDVQTGAEEFSHTPLPSLLTGLDNLGYSVDALLTMQNWLANSDNQTALPPTLQSEHHALCATLDSLGEGSLPPAAMIRMAGAVQPFISGIVTTNLPLPETTTPAALEEYIQLAATTGLKNLRCIRGGYRLDQTANIAAMHTPEITTAIAASDRPFGALAPRTAEDGYTRPDFRAIRTGDPAQARLRVRISVAEPVVEKLN